MLFPNYTTSVRTAIIFTLFTSVSLLFFTVFLNVFYWSNWISDENKDSAKDMQKIANPIFDSGPNNLGSFESKLEYFAKKVIEKWGILTTNSGAVYVSSEWNFSPFPFLWIYQKNDIWYIGYTHIIPGVWVVGVPYDITKHIHEQISLLKISVALLLTFFLIISLVSFSFARASLSPISKIISYIHSFSTNNTLPDFPLSGPKNDEFVIVAETLSDAFKKIQSQSEVLRQFSADAAHEFKTPLMIIRSEIDLAIKSGEYQNGMNNILHQLSALDAMISTLLAITRIEKEELRFEKVNISELVKNIVLKNQEIFPSSKIKVVVSIKKSIFIKTHSALLQIVVSNLIHNAFSYTKSWEIRISLDKNGFSVQDTGIGISPENIDKIWNRLFRENPYGSEIQGHWLGLYLVKTIIQKLGYDIQVESKKWVGSKFFVKFR